MDKDLKYFVALASTGEIGAKSFAKLLNCFDNMEQVWQAPANLLVRQQIPDKIVRIISQIKQATTPEAELAKISKYNISCITIHSKNYPKLLLEIPDKPAILYYKGEISNLNNPAVAIVGSRKYSDYGRVITSKIAKELANSGLVVVSGLALGIDSFAHQSVVATGGKTVAVLANGLDMIYPTSNLSLARKILDTGGTIISEFPPGIAALRHNFPIRNRIIAGLSLGTVIVEGALKSGSLITAQCSIDYNREVFAVPGDIRSVTSAGPNNLIKTGAKLVTSTEDILDELNIELKIKQSVAQTIIPDSREEAMILQCLDKVEAVHVDKIKKITKINIATLNSKLSLMEIKGKIKNIGASNYIISR